MSDTINPLETKKIQEALAVLSEHPHLIEKILSNYDKEKRKRTNWSRLSRLPYYKEIFALELRAVIDEMMVRMVPKEFRYDDFLTTEGISKNTLYLRVQQSKLYLLDYLDPDEKYKDFFGRCPITREKTGIRLTPKKVLETSTGVKPVDISLDQQRNSWQDKIDKYLELSKLNDKPLVIKNLSLTQEEVETQKISFENLECFAASITPTEIKIVRIK